MKWTRYSLLACLLAVSLNGASQELTVKSVMLQPADKAAIEQPVLDLNNDTCALIKIKVDNLEGLQFTNKTQYIGDVKYADGTYLLYKSPFSSRLISFQHDRYLPGQIDMADYGYKRLKGGKTYLVVLEAPSVAMNQSLVVLRVYPQSAAVTFDSKPVQHSATGVYEFPVGEGTYSYAVEAPDYLSSNGSVTVAKGENVTKTLRLQPITHEVTVSCNVGSAHVFVDNVDYGRVGKLRIPQGNHQIRVQADGYIDANKTVNITVGMSQLNYTLKKNENVIDVHATPVTIISDSKHIYKNNKELKGWKSGTPVMFMPGKYMLSDDNGKSKIITVGSEEMEVKM